MLTPFGVNDEMAGQTSRGPALHHEVALDSEQIGLLEIGELVRVDLVQVLLSLIPTQNGHHPPITLFVCF